MTPLIYNLSMLAGVACATAGACIVGGIGVGLLVAGGLLLACTAFSAAMVR